MVKVLDISTLGKLTLSYDSKPMQGLGSHKAEAILVYLACTGRSYARQVLAEFFWPDRPQAQSLANLRRELTILRDKLGESITITRDMVELPPDLPLRLDVTAFEAQIGALQEPTSLKTALALYRGDFLEGFFIDSPAFEEWARMERERLRYRAIDGLDALIAFSLQTGDCAGGLAYANRLLQMDPLREKTYVQLMRLLAQSNQREAALAQYDACKRLLKAELGVTPTPETTALYEQIRAGAPLGNLPPTRRLRGYELREQIGSGGFGEVYRAYQPSVNREVAVKVILPQYANEPDFIRRFEAEAQIVARLEHPHIVPLYDYWRDPDGAYLVMRLLKESLRERLKRSPLTLNEVLCLVEQVAAALTIAHRSGIVHRDLKPANILFDGEGNAYLSDFGIAKVLAHKTRTGQTGLVIGSPAYLSPEQIGQGEITPAADMYSFGILIYETLTGIHPFPADLTPTELIARHLSQPLPLVAGSRPEFSPALDEVIQKATAKTARARYPDMLSLAAAFREAAGGGGTNVPYQEHHLTPMADEQTWTPAEQMVEMRNPYKGLRAFEEADAADFFGRATLVQQLLERLKENGRYSNFLAVVGPSGSGKSSVVKAGLLPALRKGSIPGAEQWYMAHILPGAHPLEEIELALVRLATTPGLSLLTQLQENPRGLLRVVRKLFPEKSTLLLVIDQFEEVFTLSQSAEESAFFLDSLYAAITDPHSPVKLVVTLRADFYDRPLLHPAFSKLMNARTQVVTPLSPEELEEAICSPASRVGVMLEPGLAADMVAEVSAQPGALPLLQYALTELFEARRDQSLNHEAYRKLGGVSGALARKAEEVMTGLSPAGQEAAGQMFLRLVTLGEGVEDTRRRTLQSELLALGERNQGMEEAIQAFGAARLLSFDRDPVTRTPTVEVAHEAILREWTRLKGWLEESRADVRLQRLLAAGAAEWLGAERDPSYLLSGSRLAQFEAWQGHNVVALTDTEREFLAASITERQRQEQLERERQAKEARLRRRIQQAVGIVAAVSIVAAAVSIVFALIASEQSRVAEEQRAEAEKQRQSALDAQAQAEKSAADFRIMALTSASRAALASGDNDTALALAMEASKGDNPPGYAQVALNEAAYRPGTVRVITPPLNGFSIHPSGKYASSFSSSLAWVLTDVDLTSSTFGAVLATFQPETGKTVFRLTLPASSPDGRLTFMYWKYLDGTSDAIFANTDPDSPDFLKVKKVEIEDDRQTFLEAMFGGDSRTLLISGCAAEMKPDIPCNKGTVVAWEIDPETMSPVRVVNRAFLGPVRVFVRPKAFDRSTMRGLLWTIAADNARRLIWMNLDPLSPQFGQELYTFPEGSANTAAVSPDGKTIAIGTTSQVALWDLTTYQIIRKYGAEQSTVYPNGFSFDPTGKLLIHVDASASVKIYDVATGGLYATLAGTNGEVGEAQFSPDGRLVFSTGAEATRLWEYQRGEVIQPIRSQIPDFPRGWYLGMTISPDQKTYVTAGYCIGADGSHHGCGSGNAGAVLFDIATMQEIRRFDGFPAGGGWPAFSPDGNTLFVQDQQTGFGRIIDINAGTVINTIEDSQLLGCGLCRAFRADGKTLLSSTFGLNQVIVWDLTQKPAKAIKSIPSEPLSSEPSGLILVEQEGRAIVYVATGSGDIIGWDVDTGAQVVVLKGHTLEMATVPALFVTADRRRLLSGAADTAIILWDIDPKSPTYGQILRRFAGQPTWMWGVAMTPDGKYVLADSYGSGVRQWDAKTGEIVRHYEDWITLSLWPEGKSFATLRGIYNTLLLMRIDTLDELKAWIAEHRYVRPLTCEERAQYNIPPMCEAGQ